MAKPVVTIFYQFDPWNSSLGGIQTTIRSYIKYAPEAFRVRMVGTSDSSHHVVGAWQQEQLAGREVDFLPLFRLPNDNFKSRVPVTASYTAALARWRFEGDFFHFHRLEPTLVTRRWPGDKTLFVHNDLEQQRQAQPWRQLAGVYGAIERWVLPQFSEVLSCNSASTAFYRRQYAHLAKRVHDLRNTVDEEVFYPLGGEERLRQRRALAAQMGLGEETRFLLFAGRLQAQKDPLLLVRAFARLEQTDVHLLVAGTGDLLTAVREEVGRLGLQKQVSLLGPVSQERLAVLHRLSSAFVLASAYEGLPMVALEALASGTPVITTDCGETPRLLVPGSGSVCRERTPEALAAALGHLLRCPQAFAAGDCLRAAAPYSARSVVGEVYGRMFDRWQRRSSGRATVRPASC
ncbi:glycosyltransferase [Gloeobacter kilaueensis]|uniref:Glycosyl transferase group 1 n=1 Tax=Gloeobacter kilaueensis (strain ATCC BAA-2537 / CCAP 1431/1 / ULC 316 / JS1) TaxID=1183438 RepID=U5QLY7_GLOK1|nr:glycosyltransferase [Gloeobacter kilaueensis]AGY58629.1 glycosyl transferase group 1 [Gloeobacter kilaueensis JS1]